jgi:hypothetical protein
MLPSSNSAATKTIRSISENQPYHRIEYLRSDPKAPIEQILAMIMAPTTSMTSWIPSPISQRTSEQQYNLDLEAQRNAHSLSMSRARLAAETRRPMFPMLFMVINLAFILAIAYHGGPPVLHAVSKFSTSTSDMKLTKATETKTLVSLALLCILLHGILTATTVVILDRRPKIGVQEMELRCRHASADEAVVTQRADAHSLPNSYKQKTEQVCRLH